MGGAQPDGARIDLVVLIHDIHDLLTLVGVDRAVRYQQAMVSFADGNAHAGKHSRVEKLVLVRKHGANPQGASFGIHLIVYEVNGPLAWKALFVGQTQSYA